jgi:hypothetical protein
MFDKFEPESLDYVKYVRTYLFNNPLAGFILDTPLIAEEFINFDKLLVGFIISGKYVDITTGFAQITPSTQTCAIVPFALANDVSQLGLAQGLIYPSTNRTQIDPVVFSIEPEQQVTLDAVPNYELHERNAEIQLNQIVSNNANVGLFSTIVNIVANSQLMLIVELDFYYGKLKKNIIT